MLNWNMRHGKSPWINEIDIIVKYNGTCQYRMVCYFGLHISVILNFHLNESISFHFEFESELNMNRCVAKLMFWDLRLAKTQLTPEQPLSLTSIYCPHE